MPNFFVFRFDDFLLITNVRRSRSDDSLAPRRFASRMDWSTPPDQP